MVLFVDQDLRDGSGIRKGFAPGSTRRALFKHSNAVFMRFWMCKFIIIFLTIQILIADFLLETRLKLDINY